MRLLVEVSSKIGRLAGELEYLETNRKSHELQEISKYLLLVISGDKRSIEKKNKSRRLELKIKELLLVYNYSKLAKEGLDYYSKIKSLVTVLYSLASS